jgi:hypothetical protein
MPNCERLRPEMISFDVFGTLISVRDSSYGAFERIAAASGARGLGACFALAVALPLWPRHSLAASITALATNDFLNSIGVVTTFPDRAGPAKCCAIAGFDG